MGILINPDLENRIVAKVQSGRYQSPDEVVEESLALLDARDGGTRASEPPDASSISDMIVRIGAQVPEETWSHLPSDLANNVDHYLYGSPRRAE
jgi:Arc/MetJ-type ribon-helix-helix transcriptional regulator